MRGNNNQEELIQKDHGVEIATEIELIRSTEEEKGQQIANAKRYGEALRAGLRQP